MKITVKTALIISIAVCTAIMIGTLYYCDRMEQKYKHYYDRQTDNVSTAMGHIVHDTIRDSIHVASTGILTLTMQEMKEKNLYDKSLIADLQLKVRQLSDMQNTASYTADTIYLSAESDSIYNYQDRWTNFHLNLNSRQLAYRCQDSVTQIIYAEYRHHFLWWRWGIKGYRIKIVNFNPHSFITYNQYIRLK